MLHVNLCVTSLCCDVCISAYILVWAFCPVHGLLENDVSRPAVSGEVGLRLTEWAELQQLEQSPKGELRKWPQTSSQRLPREGRKGQPWLQHVISGRIVMRFPFSVCHIVVQSVKSSWICVTDCVKHCAQEVAVTLSHRPPQIIQWKAKAKWATVHLLCPPPRKTTIVLCWGCTDQLVGTFTGSGSITADSGHIKYVCVCGQWRDGGKAKWCRHTPVLLSWHVWG